MPLRSPEVMLQDGDQPLLLVGHSGAGQTGTLAELWAGTLLMGRPSGAITLLQESPSCAIRAGCWPAAVPLLLGTGVALLLAAF